MKAAVVSAAGQAPTYADFADPQAGAGEVVVEVAAAALSPLARARAYGANYSVGGSYPLVAGIDGVGRLEDGRRVYFLLPRAPFGAMAERTVVADGQWAPVLEGSDDALAAAIANPGMSSWAALTERASLPAGGTVLVNGATGAAGRLALGIARHLSAGRVIATGRNRAVLDAVGADATMPMGENGSLDPGAAEVALAAGVDVVLDYLWGQSALGLMTAAAKAAPAGRPVRFVQIGSAGGGEMRLQASLLRSSGLELVGSGLGSVPLPRLVGAVADMLGAATKAGLRLDHDTGPLADVAAAWARGGERVVFRCTGSGKTTLARRLASRLDLPHHPLDDLHWERLPGGDRRRAPRRGRRC